MRLRFAAFGRALSRKQRFREQLTAYLFLLPALTVFAVFAWYPIVRGFVISFQHIDPRRAPAWVGLANMRQLLADPLFAIAWRNTIWFTILALLIGYLVPVVLAIAVSEMRHAGAYFRLAFYLPVILPPIVTVLLWQWMFDPGPGLANTILSAFGIAPLAWLQAPRTALVSLVLIATWANAGGSMLIYLAALQGIPAHLYDAAEIDGATLWHRLWHITRPQLANVMWMMLILQIIGTMQVFTEPFVLTGGGPVNATLTVMLLMYRYAFRYNNFGAASMIGLMLFMVLTGLSLAYAWLTRRPSTDYHN